MMSPRYPLRLNSLWSQEAPKIFTIILTKTLQKVRIIKCPIQFVKQVVGEDKRKLARGPRIDELDRRCV